jgi:DNA-binding winged helix-turn-helix (wHTH) protein
MSDFRPATGDQRVRRRWSFANCVFDEASWSLTVNGQRVAVETKPLEVLRALLIEAGNLITKDELLDRIWPNVTVVEGSLPTAVHKLRLALSDESGAAPIIETVPRVGYRLGVPVHVEEAGPALFQSSTSAAELHFTDAVVPASPPSKWKRPGHLLSLSAGLVLIALVGGFALGPTNHLQATKANPVTTHRQARDALRRLDVRAIEAMLAAGWNPNKPLDDEGNGAINYVVNQCEWDHGHSGEQILLMVRTLTDGGAVIDRRNVWGDTPYSIAKANRYCGPDHPVTNYLRMLCAEGKVPLGDRCLASYELMRRGRRA